MYMVGNTRVFAANARTEEFLSAFAGMVLVPQLGKTAEVIPFSRPVPVPAPKPRPFPAKDITSMSMAHAQNVTHAGYQSRKKIRCW